MHRGRTGRAPRRVSWMQRYLLALAVTLSSAMSVGVSAQTSRAVDAMDGRTGSTSTATDQPRANPRPEGEGASSGGPRRREARAEVRAGEAAMNAGNAEAALGHFRRAYDLSSEPRTLLALSRALESLGRLDEAIACIEDAIQEGLPDHLARPALARLGALRERRAGARMTRLESEREELTRQLEEHRRAAASREDQLMLALQENQDQLQAQSTPPPESPPLYRRWWFWTLVGVAVAGGVTAGIVAGSGTVEGPFAVDDLGGAVLTLGAP